MTRFARLLGGTGAEQPGGADDPHRQIENFILGGPRSYTKDQLVAGSGLSRSFADRLWRSLGFAEVGTEELIFTDGDRAALAELEKLRVAGLVPGDVEEAMSRSVGQAMAGLADWQVEMLYQLVDYGHIPVTDDELYRLGERIIPLLEHIQTYVWRRHLAAAANRLVHEQPHGSPTRGLNVGFAELVEFSRTTRRLTPSSLTRLIEEFHRITNEVVAGQHGRVVKTVGDEVMFVADHSDELAEIALELVDRLAEADALPALRIGLAQGEVVFRFGDVFGEVVNIAARLTTYARPGRILVDRNLAAALRDDERFSLRVRRSLAVRGYRHLETWGLTRPRIRQPSEPDTS